MGIFDHRRTWQFETNASPQECIEAFVTSLTGGGLQLLASRWEVSRYAAPDGGLEAVGTYAGRGGAASVLTAMSQRSTSEQDAAIGSTLAFRVGRATGGQVRATMAMTRTAGAYLFFIADARFFRSAMNRVARTMRANDPSLVLVKS
jgi:hypothetical protein